MMCMPGMNPEKSAPSDNSWDADINQKLGKLHTKQEEWISLPPCDKLKYLDDALDKLTRSEGIATEICTVWAGSQLKNLSESSEEKEYDVVSNVFVIISVVKKIMDELKLSYEVSAGITSKDTAAMKQFKVETLSNGQVAATVFPLTFSDKHFDPSNNCICQLYFDSKNVTKESDVTAFEIVTPKHNDGICVNLGAGNYPMLTISDMLCTLFVKNQLCFVKQHHIRNELEHFMRFVFAKLYTDGYLESEMDVSIERSQKLVYHPHVTAVHVTGGKKCHDAIVWGETEQEQSMRKLLNNKKLCNATMTSELGCVTPYIVTPYQYTTKELEHQADVIVTSKLVNGGASCNAPQVIIVSKDWEQVDDFLAAIEETVRKTYTANAYYPGSRDRWNDFRTQYAKTSRTIEGVPPENGTNNKGETHHLPLLLIDVEVDLASADGYKRAKAEYAFRNEAFCPVLIVATIVDAKGSTSSKGKEADNFMANAVTLCNDCLFGSLSMSIMVPDSQAQSECIETAIQNLRYGSIVTNAWSATGYNPRTVWGGYQAIEKLENVESGLGYVLNMFHFQNIDKGVIRTPIIDEKSHFCSANKSRRDQIVLLTALRKFIIQPSLTSFISFMRAVIIPPSSVQLVTSYAVVAAAIFVFGMLARSTFF